MVEAEQGTNTKEAEEISWRLLPALNQPLPLRPSFLAVKVQHEQMANITATMEGEWCLVPSALLVKPSTRLAPRELLCTHMLLGLLDSSIWWLAGGTGGYWQAGLGTRFFFFKALHSC